MDDQDRRLERRVWIGDVLTQLGVPVMAARPDRLPPRAAGLVEDPVTKMNREARRWQAGAFTVREPGPHDWTAALMLPAFRQALETHHGRWAGADSGARVARWYPLEDDRVVVALMASGHVLLARAVWDPALAQTQIVVETTTRPEAG